MAFVQVGQLGLSGGQHAALGDQNSHRRALGVVVLPGDVQHLGADHVGEGGEDVGQSLGVVLLVDVGDVVLLLPGGFCVTHVVDVEAQRFGQVVEPVQFQLFSHRSPPEIDIALFRPGGNKKQAMCIFAYTLPVNESCFDCETPDGFAKKARHFTKAKQSGAKTQPPGLSPACFHTESI